MLDRVLVVVVMHTGITETLMEFPFFYLPAKSNAITQGIGLILPTEPIGDVRVPPA